MKNPISRIKSRWLQFAVYFLLLTCLFGMMREPLPAALTDALVFSAVFMLCTRPAPAVIDCGEHEHQHRLCIRNMMLVVECTVCRKRWHLREPSPGLMHMTWGILLFPCWFFLKDFELSEMISSRVFYLLMLAVAFLLLLLIEGVFYLCLRKQAPAKLAGAEIEMEI